MRNDGIRPAFACLKIVILETVNMLASSSVVKARPIRSIRSGSDIGSAVLFLGLHDCIYLLSGFTSAATAAYFLGTVVRARFRCLALQLQWKGSSLSVRRPISPMSAQAAQRGHFPLYSCGYAELNRRFQAVGVAAAARFALARSAAPQEVEQYAPFPFAAAGFRFSNFMHFLPLAHGL